MASAALAQSNPPQAAAPAAANTSATPAYLRRKAVAERLGVSVRTVEDWALTGGGPPFAMLGRIPVYPVADLDAWMRARMVTSTSDAAARRQREAVAS